MSQSSIIWPLLSDEHLRNELASASPAAIHNTAR